VWNIVKNLMITGADSRYIERAKVERRKLKPRIPRSRSKSEHESKKLKKGKRMSTPLRSRGLNRIQSSPEAQKKRRGPASAKPVKRRQFRKIRARGGRKDINKGHTVVNQYRVAVEKIFKKHARSKLHSLDDYFSRYEHKEHDLYLSVCGKYDVVPDRRLLMLDNMRTNIKLVFQNHDMTRYDEVDELLAVHHGNEIQLYYDLCEQYGAEKNEIMYTQEEIEKTKTPPHRKKIKKASQKVSRGSSQDAPQAGLFFTDSTFHAFLTEIYGRHNKEMLSSINSLIRNYRGRETELYLKICRKYKITPKALTQNLLSSKKMKFAIGEYVETRISNVSKDTWVLSLITDIKLNDSTYDLTVIDSGEYQVVPDATHVSEDNIRRRQYHCDDFVETRIVYGTINHDLWIPARIKKQNEDETYDLSVPGYENYKVNPEAVFVPTQFIRPILTRQMLSQIPNLRKRTIGDDTSEPPEYLRSKSFHASTRKRTIGEDSEDIEEEVASKNEDFRAMSVPIFKGSDNIGGTAIVDSPQQKTTPLCVDIEGPDMKAAKNAPPIE